MADQLIPQCFFCFVAAADKRFSRQKSIVTISMQSARKAITYEAANLIVLRTIKSPLCLGRGEQSATTLNHPVRVLRCFLDKFARHYMVRIFQVLPIGLRYSLPA